MRSFSAEAIRAGARRPQSKGGARSKEAPSRLADARGGRLAASADRGLSETAYEVGCALTVQRGVFVPAEGASTLLESLLKLSARP